MNPYLLTLACCCSEGAAPPPFPGWSQQLIKYQISDSTVQISFPRTDLVGQVSDKTFISAYIEQAKNSDYIRFWEQFSNINMDDQNWLWTPLVWESYLDQVQDLYVHFPTWKAVTEKHTLKQTNFPFFIASLHSSPEPYFSILTNVNRW